MASENQHWASRFLAVKFSDKDGRVFLLKVSVDTLGKRSRNYTTISIA